MCQFSTQPLGADGRQVFANVGRFLTVEGDTPGPVVQLLILGPLLGRTVEDDGQSTALVDHQPIKLGRQNLLEALLFEGKSMIEVKHGIGRGRKVGFPVVGCSTMEGQESPLVEHRSAYVADEMLHFDRLVVGRPAEQSTFVKFTDVIPSTDFIGRERAWKKHHVIKRFERIVAQTVEHGLFDKGLNVGTCLREGVALSVEIQGHRMTVKGFGHVKAGDLVEVLTEEGRGFLCRKCSKSEQRPVKPVGDR